MYVHAYETREEMESKLKQRGLVSQPKTIQQFRAQGIYEVHIDTSKGADSPFGFTAKCQAGGLQTFH